MGNDSNIWPIFAAGGTIAVSIAVVAAIVTGTCIDTQFGKINCQAQLSDDSAGGDLSGSKVDAEGLANSREESAISNDLSTVPSTIQQFDSVATGSGSDEISQDEAIALVKAWLEAKPEIYGSLYNLELAKAHVISQKLKDVERQVQGLQQGNSYWTFDTYSIGRIWAFDYFSDKGTAEILLEITETLSLYENGSRNGSKSGTFQNSYRFYFGRDSEGAWKISDSSKE